MCYIHPLIMGTKPRSGSPPLRGWASAVSVRVVTINVLRSAVVLSTYSCTHTIRIPTEVAETVMLYKQAAKSITRTCAAHIMYRTSYDQ